VRASALDWRVAEFLKSQPARRVTRYLLLPVGRLPLPDIITRDNVTLKVNAVIFLTRNRSAAGAGRGLRLHPPRGDVRIENALQAHVDQGVLRWRCLGTNLIHSCRRGNGLCSVRVFAANMAL